MLIDELHGRRDELIALGHRYGARRLRIFGSVARRQDKPDSDIDFLVDFPRGYDMFKQRIALTNAISDLVGRRVELVPEHELSPHLQSSILGDAVDL